MHSGGGFFTAARVRILRNAHSLYVQHDMSASLTLAWHVQAASKRLLPLANKYNIRGVEAQCHDALASMLSNSSNRPPAGEVLELLGIATSLGLVQLQSACRDLISLQLEKVSDDVMNTQGSTNVLVVADAWRFLRLLSTSSRTRRL